MVNPIGGCIVVLRGIAVIAQQPISKKKSALSMNPDTSGSSGFPSDEVSRTLCHQVPFSVLVPSSRISA